MRNCGIYCLRFPNGLFYVGSSGTIKRRIRSHEWHLEQGRHPNDRMQKTYNKYLAMEKITLLVCSKAELKFYEQIVISGLHPQLNLSRIAYRPEMTPEVCAKIAAAARGRIVSDETRLKMAKSRLGQRFTPEQREMLSSLAKGRKNSAAAKLKMAQAKTGKSLSDAHRAKLSEALIKRWAGWSETQKRAIMRKVRFPQETEGKADASVS